MIVNRLDRRSRVLIRLERLRQTDRIQARTRRNDGRIALTWNDTENPEQERYVKRRVLVFPLKRHFRSEIFAR